MNCDKATLIFDPGPNTCTHSVVYIHSKSLMHSDFMRGTLNVFGSQYHSNKNFTAHY